LERALLLVQVVLLGGARELRQLPVRHAVREVQRPPDVLQQLRARLVGLLQEVYRLPGVGVARLAVRQLRLQPLAVGLELGDRLPRLRRPGVPLGVDRVAGKGLPHIEPNRARTEACTGERPLSTHIENLGAV
jgi:hypothetical protein